jgi:hypothetical protein
MTIKIDETGHATIGQRRVFIGNGGAGSGNFGHAGRPGLVGGSGLGGEVGDDAITAHLHSDPSVDAIAEKLGTSYDAATAIKALWRTSKDSDYDKLTEVRRLMKADHGQRAAAARVAAHKDDYVPPASRPHMATGYSGRGEYILPPKMIAEKMRR